MISACECLGNDCFQYIYLEEDPACSCSVLYTLPPHIVTLHACKGSSSCPDFMDYHSRSGYVHMYRKYPSPTAALKLERDRDVKVAKLTEDDDIEAYLTTFERLMKAYEIREERWAFKLASQLVGKAQQAYAAMNPEDAAQLKKAILRRYDINEESYRQRFRFEAR